MATTYGGLEVNELKRLKELEKENARLKRMYAEKIKNDSVPTYFVLLPMQRTSAITRKQVAGPVFI